MGLNTIDPPTLARPSTEAGEDRFRALNARSILLALVSIALGAALIVLLVRVAKVDFRSVLAGLAGIDRFAFLRLTGLMGLNVYLSAEKWRLIDRVMRRSTDSTLSRGAL